MGVNPRGPSHFHHSHTEQYGFRSMMRPTPHCVEEAIAAGSHITSRCPCRAKEIKKDDKAANVIILLLSPPLPQHEILLPPFYFFTSFSLLPTPRQEIPLLANQFPTNNCVTQIFVLHLSVVTLLRNPILRFRSPENQPSSRTVLFGGVARRQIVLVGSGLPVLVTPPLVL